ncbi:hypothetical protein CDAR_396501 [Caerostris darwini]|uniref:Uncharacterized protein n=1 Tax=Caerostris darwini TaxID=1538125 RepID=A0AAV4PMA1_9ARAC|nr:hypothetical protein CDAR_396501 [Caerostris darwini]
MTANALKINIAASREHAAGYLYGSSSEDATGKKPDRINEAEHFFANYVVPPCYGIINANAAEKCFSNESVLFPSIFRDPIMLSVCNVLPVNVLISAVHRFFRFLQRKP